MPTIVSHALVLIEVFLSSCRSHNIHILARQRTEMERQRKMKKVRLYFFNGFDFWNFTYILSMYTAVVLYADLPTCTHFA